MNYYNSEGYADPTAYEALRRIEKEERKARYRPIVYICSPFSHGDVDENITSAKKYSRYAVENHCIPIAPHLLFPQFMNDKNPQEHELAIFMNRVLLGKCEEMWVFGKTHTPGMQEEMEWARQKRISIRFIYDIERNSQDV